MSENERKIIAPEQIKIKETQFKLKLNEPCVNGNFCMLEAGYMVQGRHFFFFSFYLLRMSVLYHWHLSYLCPCRYACSFARTHRVFFSRNVHPEPKK
jgi:hypothetical protein